MSFSKDFEYSVENDGEKEDLRKLLNEGFADYLLEEYPPGSGQTHLEFLVDRDVTLAGAVDGYVRCRNLQRTVQVEVFDEEQEKARADLRSKGDFWNNPRPK